MRVDRVFERARIATMAGDGLGLIEDGAIAIQDGRIAWIGPRQAAPNFETTAVKADAEDAWITPGLIDCHTHLVYAGSRAREFEARLAGASYEEIARSGGGIVSTVKATRAASAKDLLNQSLARLFEMAADGVTTVEIKSGYGLDTETELKQLRVARALGGGAELGEAVVNPVQKRVPKISVVTTFLGAHALPPEAHGDKDAYITKVCAEMIPAVAREKLADAVDAFMEGIAFDARQTRRVFEAARRYGLRVKLHADQLSDMGGAALAAEFAALSADHLEFTNEAGALAMAKAGTVAVLLPGAFYFLRETRKPPIELFRKHGVKMALATDCNPGSSPMTSPLMAMNMAATLFRMTVPECLAGFTREAARALGLLHDRGTLEVGKRADLVVWNVDNLAELVYRIGGRMMRETYVMGEPQ